MDALASPGDLVLDLPYPPSVNRLWRATGSDAKKVYLAPSYVKWKGEANGLLMTQRGWMTKRVTSLFSAEIALCPPKGQPRGDLDNRIKAVLDFLQASTIIANDRHCQLVCAYWIDRDFAPEGCRVRVKPWGPSPRTVNDVLRAVAERLEAAK